MSQQLDRPGVRPPDSTLLTYTGQVMEVHAAEVGSTGKNRPRKIVISDSPGTYKGKTFRCWEWRDTFGLLQPGAQVTVHYEVEPNPDPTRHGSNMISHVETTASGGGQADVGGEVSGGQPASQPTNGNGSWGQTPSNWTAPRPQQAPPPAWGQTKGHIEETNAKKDYWERREEADVSRSLEMEAAWAVKAVLDLNGPDHGLSDESLLQDAIRLILLKRRCASEMR